MLSPYRHLSTPVIVLIAYCLLGIVSIVSLRIDKVLALQAPESTANALITAQSSHNADFNPYIVAIPGSGLNNSTLLVSASGLGEQPNLVYVSADQGPTSRKHSYTMEFDETTEIYRHTLESFFEDSRSVSGSIEITTSVETGVSSSVTETITSGKRYYERWPVFRDQINQLDWGSGVLTLFIDVNTLPAELAFIVAVETLAPLTPPTGWQSISHAYSIQPSGSVALASRPYLFILRYTEEQIEGIDPAELVLFWFDPTTETWQMQGGTTNLERNDIVLSTYRFGTFMLFAPDEQPTMTPTATDTRIPISTATMTPTATNAATVTPAVTMAQTATSTATTAPTQVFTPISTPTGNSTLVQPSAQTYLPIIQVAGQAHNSSR